MENKELWILNTRQHYDDMIDKWEFTNELYDGTPVIDNPQKYFSTRTAIERRVPEAFEERAQSSHYPNYTGFIIDSLANNLYRRSPDAERNWGSLGNPEQEGSDAYVLWNDFNGTGENYPVWVNRLILKLILNNEVWVLVDGIDERGVPVVRLIDPTRVTFWKDNEWVLVKEYVEAVDLKQGSTMEEHYRLYRPDGWEVYKLDIRNDRIRNATTKDVVLIGEGSYESPMRTDTGRSVPPLFRVGLPLDRYPAWQIANDGRFLFEFKSYITYLARQGGLGNRLVIGADSDMDLDDVLDDLGRSTVIQESSENSGQHRYISPSTGHGDFLKTFLKEEIERLEKAAYKMMDNTARHNVTATEVIMNNNHSTSAFLTMVKATVEDAERRILRAVQQKQFPGNPQLWNATVEWPEFVDIPDDEMIQRNKSTDEETS